MRPLIGLVLRYYVRAFTIFIREPAFRALGFAALFVLLAGTVFYHSTENWSWVDSLYFSMVTLATVGYGDFAPTSDFTRIVTVFYILFGFGVVATFLSVLVKAPLLMSGSITPQALGLSVPASLPPTAKSAPEKQNRHYRRAGRLRRRNRSSSRSSEPNG
jgi:hypothetical protein